MASPHAGLATHSQTTVRASPKGATARWGGNRWQRGARKGLPPVTSPTASRGGDAGHKGGRPLAGRLSAGKSSHRLRDSGTHDAVAGDYD
ncbi:hypothetical protein BHM03_00056186, partial [Ensete ventricosum]